MTKRLKTIIAAVAAIAAASVAVTLAAGGGGGNGGEARGDVIVDPHGGKMERAELRRVLAATERASSSTPKAELEAQGEKLFTSTQLAKRGESCAGCHVTSGGINAPLGVITHRRDPSKPIDQDNFTGVREAPSLWDVADTAPYNWIGGNPTLEAQSATAITTHFVDENPTGERVAAMTAFLKTIRAPQTRHDQGRLTEMELAGEEVFVGKGGCIACHGGPQFTDNIIHDTDVPQNNVAALGGPSNDPGAKGIPEGFNTPQLRDIRNTAPYMHNGVFKTLREVVDFYDLNVITGGPLGLTEQQKDELVAYLKTL